MKKIFSFVLVAAILSTIFVFSAYADGNDPSGYKIEYLENGDYIVTYFDDDANLIPDDGAKGTVVHSKTSRYYNSSGETMWYVTVTGKFTYNGVYSSCTEAAHAAGAPGASWSIISASHSKSGNTAKATAKARHTSGVGYSDYTRSVTIKCAPNGVIT